jgi:hypothetical protein
MLYIYIYICIRMYIYRYDELIGMYQIDLISIYNKKDHEKYRIWGALRDPLNKEDSGSQGMLVSEHIHPYVRVTYGCSLKRHHGMLNRRTSVSDIYGCAHVRVLTVSLCVHIYFKVYIYIYMYSLFMTALLHMYFTLIKPLYTHMYTLLMPYWTSLCISRRTSRQE